MKLTPTTAIFIDRYHPKADKRCAISIRITYRRIKKYYLTKFSLTIAEYERMVGQRPRAEMKSILLQLQSLEKKACDIIDRMQFFSFSAFEKLFFQNRGLTETIEYACNKCTEQLEEDGRIGSAMTYKGAKISLFRFCKETGIKDQITFSHITPEFLKKYEKWMLEQGRSTTTIGIYLRSLRTLFNSAISEGLITKDFYPFGKRKYEIPISKNYKKALSLSEIAMIYNYKTLAGSTTERMKDFWMFIYYCNGLNVKDLCRLRYKNIHEDFISFKRSKTETTKRTNQEIRVPLLAEAKTIIKKYGNKAINNEAYIFPILEPNVTPSRERELIKLFTRLINDHMRKIAIELDIKTNVTTYVARHSFATVLKRSGASIEFISEALGHNNIKTTQNYLASFEDDKKKEIAQALTAFKLAN